MRFGASATRLAECLLANPYASSLRPTRPSPGQPIIGRAPTGWTRLITALSMCGSPICPRRVARTVPWSSSPFYGKKLSARKAGTIQSGSADQSKRAPMMQKRVNMSVPGVKARTGGRVGRRMPSAKPSPIGLTIGHSTRTLEEFIRLLQAHGATRVADVRTVPRSRHNPQFNKTSLSRALKKAGLGYVHLPGLGGLRHAKRDSLNVGWRNASFRGYADYMQTPEFEQSLEELIGLANQDRIALMCAEAVPWRCHRSLIADALLVRGIRTEDIMSLTRRQVHVLTPFAKVRGTTITYPAEVLPSTPKKPSAKCSRPRPIKTA